MAAPMTLMTRRTTAPKGTPSASGQRSTQPSRRTFHRALGMAVCAGLTALIIVLVHLFAPQNLALFLFFCGLSLLSVALPATGPRGQRVGLLPTVGLAALLLLPPQTALLPLLLANTAYAFSRDLPAARRIVYERGVWLLLATLTGGYLFAALQHWHASALAGLPADVLAAAAYGSLYVLGRYFRLHHQFGASRTVRRHAYRHWRLEAVTIAVTTPLAVLMARAYAEMALPGLFGTAALLALMLLVAHFGFEVAALREQVRAMGKLSAVTVSQTNAPKVIERFLALSAGLVSSDRVVLWLTNESLTRLEQTTAAASSARPGSTVLDTVSVRFGEGLVGRVAERKNPLIVRDGAHDPRLLAEEQRQEGTAFSMLLLPLVAGDETIGVVQFERDAPGAFAPRDISRIQALGSQAAATLANVRAHQDVYSQAVTDALTGLFNRRQMQTVLADERRRAQRYGHSLSVIMLDVDSFKSYNDTYGHVQGDILLKMIAAILRENVRGVDIVGRFGGEEFIILMPETTSLEAYQTAERLRVAVAQTVFPGFADDPELVVFKTISLGVATFPDITQDTQALVTLADNALYRAKRSGRNQTVQADAEILTLERE